MATAETEPAGDGPWAKQLWSATSTTNKLLAAALLCALLSAVGYMIFSGGISRTGGKVPLLAGHEFTNIERNSALKAFDALTLTGYEVDGSQIFVPEDELNTYLAALSQGDALPGNFYQAFDDYIKNLPWWSSRSTDERIFHVSKQRALSEIISSFPDVASASVIVTEKPQIGLRKSGVEKASVKIAMVGNRSMEPVFAEQIKKLVAHAFRDLTEDQVVVVGNIASGAAGTNDFHAELAKLENKYLQYKAAYSEYYRSKIEPLVAHLDGAHVVVNVEVDSRKNINTHNHWADKGPISTMEVSDRTSGSSPAGGPQGVPGTQTNVDAPGQAPNVGATAGGETSNETDSTQSLVYDNVKTETTNEVQDFTPTKVGVVINIPRRYRAQADQAAVPGAAPAAGETPVEPPITVNEQDLIGSVLALDYPGVSADSIRIHWIQTPPTAEPAAETGGFGEMFSGLSFWPILLTLLGVVAVVAAALVAMRAPSPESLVKPAIDEEEQEEEEQYLPDLGTDAESQRFQQLKSGVTDLVSADPEIAANLIRRWIQTA